MDYRRIYDQIIDRGKERVLEGYREKHHIIPKCLGGTNEKQNLVELTAREHFICHWLLTRMFPSNAKISYAFWAMSNQVGGKLQRTYKVSSRTYCEAKEGLTVTKEHKSNISKALKKLKIKPPGNEGIPHSENTKALLSKQRRGVKWKDRMSREAFERTVESRKDNNPMKVPEVRAKAYVSKFGKDLPEEKKKTLFLEKIEFYKQRDIKNQIK